MLLEINIPKKYIGLAFAAIGGFVGFYWLPQQAAAKEAETNSFIAQTRELKAKQENLVNLQNNKSQFQADREAFTKESAEILQQFPTFMFLEDKILYADDIQKEEMVEFNLKEFRYGSSEYVMSTSYSEDSLMELYSVSCVGEFEGISYPKFKELINFGKSDKTSQRFVLKTIEVRFDEETGYLRGEFTYNTYFIAGQENPYVFDPSILELIGTERRIDDLFGARVESDTEDWDEEYGAMIDDVLDDIVTGTDSETIN